MSMKSMQSQRDNNKDASKCGMGLMRTPQQLLAVFLWLMVSQTHHALAQAAPPQDCSRLSNPQDRHLCEERFSQSVKASSRTAELDGGWRLVRTPNPQGGPEAVSIMHVSDTAKSDFALAGLTLRCGGMGIEPLLIVLEPLASGSRPQVTVTAGSTQSQFEGSAVQGGMALLLPQTASNLAAGAWQSTDQISVEIAIKPVPIRGVLPVTGLSKALRTLTQICTSR
jgi:hypothetical protein